MHTCTWSLCISPANDGKSIQLNNLEIIRTLVKVETKWVNCLAVTSDIQRVLSVVEKTSRLKLAKF